MQATISAPVGGQVVPIEQVADPAFSEKMMGDGLAVRPALVRQDVVAPAAAAVTNISKTGHAVVLSVGGHFEVLIHIGIDTVDLKGEGFKVKARNGDVVRAGQPLIEVDFPAVAPKVPSVDVITIVTNLEGGDRLEKVGRGPVKAGEALFTVQAGACAEAPAEAAAASPAGGEAISEPVTVLNAVGLHARPALAISQIAAKYSSVRLHKGHQECNAKSIAGLMGLNAACGDEVVVAASGPDAAEAIAEITAAIRAGLGEAVRPPKPEAAEKAPEPADFSSTVELKGTVASPGLAVGPIHQARARKMEFPERSDDPEAELAIFEDSLLVSETLLGNNIAEAEERKQTAKAGIFRAHVGILKDEEIVASARALIGEGFTAAEAYRRAVAAAVGPLRGIDNPVLKERLLDFRDVEQMMLMAILGLISNEKVSLPQGSILAAEELAPSELTHYDGAAGYLLAKGSATSHVSIMIRNMGLPAIVAAGQAVTAIPAGATAVLDATAGTAVINPAPGRLAAMAAKRERLSAIHRRNLNNVLGPAVTKDGLRLVVRGNVSNAKEARKAAELGAEGLGLFRTEFLFLGGVAAPTAEVHRHLYQEILDAMPNGGPVTFRLLDVGGDKPISYIAGPQGEENPIMGLRGVRNYPLNEEVVRDQVRGLLALRPLSRVGIMIPMVGEVGEYRWVKNLLDEEKAALGVTESVPLGVMVEVPSLALTAALMAKEAAFFSIGTNDLTQYTLAMDRGNAPLAARLSHLHPALLNMIGMTAAGAQAGPIPTAVCGAMASDALAVPLLIGLGVNELAVATASIADVKAVIRDVTAEKCRQMAGEARKLASAAEVKNLLLREFGDVLPL